MCDDITELQNDLATHICFERKKFLEFSIAEVFCNFPIIAKGFFPLVTWLFGKFRGEIHNENLAQALIE